MEAQENQPPRIYILDNTAFSQGHNHGVWLDATLPPEQMVERIQAMLAASPAAGASDWEIFDSEGFDDLWLRPDENLALVSEMAALIREKSTLAAKLLAIFDRDIRYVRKILEERYRGCYPSLGAYVRWLYDELGEEVEPGEDEEAIGKAMEFNAEIFTVATDIEEIHVFAR